MKAVVAKLTNRQIVPIIVEEKYAVTLGCQVGNLTFFTIEHIRTAPSANYKTDTKRRLRDG